MRDKPLQNEDGQARLQNSTGKNKKNPKPASQRQKISFAAPAVAFDNCVYTLYFKAHKKTSKQLRCLPYQTFFESGERKIIQPAVLPGPVLPGRLRPCAPIRPQFHSPKALHSGYMSARQQLPWIRKNAGRPAPQAGASE